MHSRLDFCPRLSSQEEPQEKPRAYFPLYICYAKRAENHAILICNQLSTKNEPFNMHLNIWFKESGFVFTPRKLLGSAKPDFLGLKPEKSWVLYL